MSHTFALTLEKKDKSKNKSNKMPSLSKILLDENVERLGEIKSIEEYYTEMEKPDFLSSFIGKPSRPQLSICPITLLPATYKDPETKIFTSTFLIKHYAD